MKTKKTKMASSNHSRSVSYPPESNPIVQKIEDELINLRKSEASSTSLTQTICIGLKGLAKLYSFVDDILRLPLLFPQKLSQNHNQIMPLIEASSKLLQICDSSKHILVKLVEALRILGSSTRDEFDIPGYLCCRKDVAKKAKELILGLRETEENLVPKIEFKEECEVIRVLRCVSIINISVLESLLRFLAMPLFVTSKVKSNRFGLFSKLGMRKQSRSVNKSEEKLGKGRNELSNFDALLHAFEADKNVGDVAKIRVEVLEGSLKGIEDGLNSMFKQLTKTRASLMNTISV